MIDTRINDKHNLPYGVFRDVQTQPKNKTDLSDSDGNSVSFIPKSEFERFVMNRFKRSSEKTGKLEKHVLRMERKIDEIIKNYVDSSSATKGSDEEN